MREAAESARGERDEHAAALQALRDEMSVLKTIGEDLPRSPLMEARTRAKVQLRAARKARQQLVEARAALEVERARRREAEVKADEVLRVVSSTRTEHSRQWSALAEAARVRAAALRKVRCSHSGVLS